MNFYKLFTDILVFRFTFCFSLHFSSLARSFTRYGFTFCAILTHLTCFDIFTIVLKSPHLIILMIISPPIQSLIITLHYTTIGIYVGCFAYVFEVLRSAYFYPLSHIWYIEGLTNSVRFEFFLSSNETRCRPQHIPVYFHLFQINNVCLFLEKL